MQLNVEDGVEYLYLAVTSQHFIVKTTLDGEVIFKLGYPEQSGLYMTPEEYVPTNIAIAPEPVSGIQMTALVTISALVIPAAVIAARTTIPVTMHWTTFATVTEPVPGMR